MTKNQLDNLSYEIIGAAIEVHKHFGPGLLESVYHKAIHYELAIRGFPVDSEARVAVNYKGLILDVELRCDLVVENAIVVELKSIECFAPVHEAQILSYMRLLNKPKGILINFNCANIFKHGQKTFVNELYRDLPS